MRECPFCGNEIPDRSRVCIYCGGRLGEADDAGVAARKHRQIVLTTAAVGVFVVLVIVFSLLATVISKNGDEDGGDNFVPGGYVFSSHTSSVNQIEGSVESGETTGSESSRSSSSSGRRRASSSSSRSKGSVASSSGAEASSPAAPDSSYSSEPDTPPSSEPDVPPESSSETPPESSSSETPPPESSSGGFVPPED